MLDYILGKAKTQEDLLGAEGIMKTLSKRLKDSPLQIACYQLFLVLMHQHILNYQSNWLIILFY
jgi:hypothetical protein